MYRRTLSRALLLALVALLAASIVIACGRSGAAEPDAAASAPPARLTPAGAATDAQTAPSAAEDAGSAYPTATPTAQSGQLAKAAAVPHPGLVARLSPHPAATPAVLAHPAARGLESAAPKPAGRSLSSAAPAKLVRLPVPDRLVLPALDLDTPVVELGWSTQKNGSGEIFSEWDVAEYAAGWHKNSALPGEGGNIVFSGHNNILGAVFRELDRLERGDLAQLYVGDQVYEYAIDKVMIVPEKHATDEQRKANAGWIMDTGEEQLTLVSCWPRDDNTHRIIVVAHPVAKALTSDNK